VNLTPGFLARAFSHLGEPSSKRVIAGWSAVALCVVFVAIGGACAWRIYKNGDIGLGAAGALTFSGGTVVTLAGVIFRKPDGVAAPSAPGGLTAVGCAKPSTVEKATDGGAL